MFDHKSAGLDFVFVYLDDILFANESEAQHLEHLRLLFEQLEENGLVVKAEKCLFGVPEIDFLGHRVSRDGILPLPSKVKAISNFPAPATHTALEQFVGMVNFYHVFVPRADLGLNREGHQAPAMDSIRAFGVLRPLFCKVSR